jgi:hypothetical protein
VPSFDVPTKLFDYKPRSIICRSASSLEPELSHRAMPPATEPIPSSAGTPACVLFNRYLHHPRVKMNVPERQHNDSKIPSCYSGLRFDRMDLLALSWPPIVLPRLSPSMERSASCVSISFQTTCVSEISRLPDFEPAPVATLKRSAGGLPFAVLPLPGARMRSLHPGSSFTILFRVLHQQPFLRIFGEWTYSPLKRSSGSHRRSVSR